jgi:signal transduction histidine kinase
VVRRLLPAGLRPQLALAIAVVTALALGLTLLTVYHGIGARLQAGIDEELETQAAEWEQLRRGEDVSTPARLERAARRYLASQTYHPASRVFVVDVVGGAPVSNQPDVLEREVEEESEEGDAPAGLGVLDAGSGLATARVEEAGRMRVLTVPIDDGGRRVGTLQVAASLQPVAEAQESLVRTFALVGSLALVLAVGIGALLATLITRPLRRIASVASAVDAGDLSLRAGTGHPRGEVGVLAGAFDHMLARLERAFARQRDFVSDASHELRTPLAVLRAQVELLDREADAARRHEATATLLRRLDEMDRLVADLLTLASAEAERLVVPEEIELEAFFEDVRRDLPLFGERDFRFAAVGGTLRGDPDRLTQVLRNLVRNAVSHTQEGDRIDVRARPHGDRLVVSVTDTGPGIPPEHLDRVFERFYRVEESRPRDRGGSGLGLAIARAIVEGHGGSIRAESAPGEGTTISIELPGYAA